MPLLKSASRLPDISWTSGDYRAEARRLSAMGMDFIDSQPEAVGFFNATSKLFLAMEEALMHRKNPAYFKSALASLKGQILPVIALGRSIGASFFYAQGKPVLALLDMVESLSREG